MAEGDLQEADDILRSHDPEGFAAIERLVKRVVYDATRTRHVDKP